MKNPNVDVVTYCPDLDKLQTELDFHYANKTPLAPHISQDEGGYWILAFMTGVVKNGLESVAMMRLYPHAAHGLFDEDGNKMQPSMIEIANTRQVVIEVWAEGNCRSPEDDPRQLVLTTDHGDKYLDILGTRDILDEEGHVIGQEPNVLGGLA